MPSVPSLFRLTLLGTGYQRKAMRSEIAAHGHSPRYRKPHRKFELYFDA
jgi:hypothetical protein